MARWFFSILGWVLLAAAASAQTSSNSGNRLVYLDEDNPFYPNLDFPKLTTPQWVRDTNVEAVVVLAIDDLREPARYEEFLRPILDRLKQIDPQAGLSIMAVNVDPAHAQLQAWLRDNVSIEVHTLTHPCPLLSGSNFLAAARTYHEGIARLSQIPGNQPVAYRMPCCDSINSPSPRFYAEIFNRTNGSGQFLTIDSSVMNIFTRKDPGLPARLVIDPDGRDKFSKYLPFPSFVTTIENYPYPYVIGRLCWEFPAVVPSDWEAQHLQGTNHADTVRDWKAALDATVMKQGVFNLIFHPHGWISNLQVVELLDYAAQRYGRRVKFLNFRQVQSMITRNLLAGENLRTREGGDNGVRLLDLNRDGYLDVVIGHDKIRKTRLWQPGQRQWMESSFPVSLLGEGKAAHFGILRASGEASFLWQTLAETRGWHFEKDHWTEDPFLGRGLDLSREPGTKQKWNSDFGLRMRDLDRDGICELIIANAAQNAILSWSAPERMWKRLDYALPDGVPIVDSQDRDNGLRFIDVNEDGYDDILFSNPDKYSLHLFVFEAVPILGWNVGWSDQVIKIGAGEPGSIPPFVRGGEYRNNGAWIHSRQVWWQNEETGSLPNHVDRRSFAELLQKSHPASKSAEESLRALHVREGFKVELVAAEPLVKDPIAFDWDGAGKLWVVEMGDYPSGLDGQGQPGGVVRFLEDTNADGRYDQSTIFLEGLNFPTGLIPWKKGVIVSAAPEIFYAEDTNGDGKADLRRALFVGFNEGNQQHRVNGFDYGLDNWIYGANGDSGGAITPAGGGASVNLTGRDFRFKPEEGIFEAIAGQTQFGRHRDDWGNWFGNNNPNLLWHFYLPERYVARNPFLPVPSNKQMLAQYPDGNRVYPASRDMTRFNFPEAINRVTSANSATPYRDDLFGDAFTNAIFISEPVHNLVHLELLEPRGVTFRSQRAPEETRTEFLASEDNWFRPTMLKTGPDGALYVADMYRLVLEHPEWIPREIQKRFELRAGSEEGRIYRVYPANAKLRPIPRLDQLEIPALVDALDSSNGWQRDTVQRLLVERQDVRAVAPLKKLALESSSPKTRLQACATLAGLNAADPDLLLDALRDAHPAVRELAVRLSEGLLNEQAVAARAERRALPGAPADEAAPPPAKIQNALLALVGDPSPRVRYQLAFSLGEWNDRRAGEALSRLAVKDFTEPAFRVAILSSALRHLAVICRGVLGQPAPSAELVESLANLAAVRRDEGALAEVFSKLQFENGPIPGRWPLAALAGILDGLDHGGLSLENLHQTSRAPLQKVIENADKVFQFARSTTDQADTAGRQIAEAELILITRLLGRARSQRLEDGARLEQWLRPSWPAGVQRAAAAALLRLKPAANPAAVVKHWPHYGPAVRLEILNLLLSSGEGVKLFLQAVEEGTIPATEIGPIHRDRLLTHSVSSIRARAEKLLAGSGKARAELLRDYQRVGSLIGDVEKGQGLYLENCAACHQLKGQGTDVGPSLETVRDKPTSALLAAILDPNQAAETRYINYIARLKSNSEVSGIIVSETPNNITLRMPGGTEAVILRADLQELTSTGRSLMPEGLEIVLTPQRMADLLEYLRRPDSRP